MTNKKDALRFKDNAASIEGRTYEAIAVSDFEMSRYGCPHCGYRSGYTPISCGSTSVWRCGECEKMCYVLSEGCVESNSTPPVKLQPHPRKGIPAHGRPDKRPEGGGEFFRSRGIGLDICTCFICGTNDRTGKGETYLNNIAAYVQCRAAGERIVEMFKRGARLDYREYEPDYVQVKIGACNKHLKNLKKLDQLTKDGVITEEIISQSGG